MLCPSHFSLTHRTIRGQSTARFVHQRNCALLQIPFVRQAPMVTFRKPIGSVSVSGHKFVGAPVPCGVVITRKQYVEALSSDVEYLNSRDATIMGSRNGHAPLYLWYTLTKKGYEGMRKDVEKCLRNAHLLKVTPVFGRAGQLTKCWCVHCPPFAFSPSALQVTHTYK